MSDPMLKEDEFLEPMNFGDFLALSKSSEDRYEYVEGEVYEMASPMEAHQIMVGGLITQLTTQLAGKPCRPFVAPMDVWFPLHPEMSEEELAKSDAIRVYQPDVFVVCDKSKRRGTHIQGAPDFIIEVLSDSSRSRDRVEKFDFFLKQGVREYWTVDIEKAQVVIARIEELNGIHIYRTMVLEARGKQTVEAINVTIDFDTLFQGQQE